MNGFRLCAAWLILVLGTTACDRVDDRLRKVREAEERILVVYGGADPHKAREALILYRNQVIESGGFSGLLSVPGTLVPTDARLFVISRHIGDDPAAERWFRSYTSNLNIVRDSEGKSRLSPDERAVADLVDRLDGAAVPKWKTGWARP